MEIYSEEKIFNYSDYRIFLKDYFTEQKRLKTIFSHRYFAHKSGFSSSSFVSHVMKGERNLTEKSLEKIMKGLNLHGKAKDYFEKLVKYNQSKKLEEKEKIYNELLIIKKNYSFEGLGSSEYAYYENWYNSVIRELVVQDNWEGDYKKLAKMVIPKITPEMARKSVEILLKIGMIKYKDGNYFQNTEFVTSKKIPSFILKETRNEYIKKGLEAAELINSKDRFITSTTFTMTKEVYEEVMKELEEIRKKVVLSKSTENHGEVYQFNIQLFPMSKNI